MRDWAVVDPRSLGLYRMALAGAILLDLAWRARHLTEYYTSQGVLPLRELLRLGGAAVGPSLFMAGDGFGVVCLLFLALALASLFLGLGYQTRAATAACLILEVSLHYRNPLIIDGGDALLRCLLVWGLFLPWQRSLALDSGPESTAPPPAGRDLGLLLYWLQILQLYLFAALYKTGPSWFSQRDAVLLTLSFDELATPLGAWLSGWSWLSGIASPLVPIVELTAPFFLLAPGRWRWLGIAPLAILQLSLTLTLSLGLFNPLALVALLPFLPESFWATLLGRRLESGVRGRLERLRRRARLPNPEAGSPLPLWARAVAVGLMLMVIGVNVAERLHVKVPDIVGQARIWTGLYQQWSMFSPDPPATEGWLDAEATLPDGSQVSLLYDDPSRLLEPRVPLSSLLDPRTRRLFTSLRNPEMELFQKLYLRSLVEAWNREHAEQPVSKATLWHLSRPTLSASPATRQSLSELP